MPDGYRAIRYGLHLLILHHAATGQANIPLRQYDILLKLRYTGTTMTETVIYWGQGGDWRDVGGDVTRPREYGYFYYPNGWGLSRRGDERDDCLLHVTLQGQPRVWHGTRCVESCRGSVSFHPRGEDQHYRAALWEGYYFHFVPSPVLLDSLRTQGITTEGATWSAVLSDAILERLADVFAFPQLPRALAQARCTALIEYLLYTCLPPSPQAIARPQRMRVQEIVAYLPQHLALPHTVESLADMAHLSPSRFAHLFRAEVGMSVYAYLQHLRLQRAQHLLATTDRPAAHIGEDVGYTRPTYFYAAFKRAMGCTPHAYRSRQISSAGACRPDVANAQ